MSNLMIAARGPTRTARETIDDLMTRARELPMRVMVAVAAVCAMAFAMTASFTAQTIVVNDGQAASLAQTAEPITAPFVATAEIAVDVVSTAVISTYGAVSEVTGAVIPNATINVFAAGVLMIAVILAMAFLVLATMRRRRELGTFISGLTARFALERDDGHSAPDCNFSGSWARTTTIFDGLSSNDPQMSGSWARTATPMENSDGPMLDLPAATRCELVNST